MISIILKQPDYCFNYNENINIMTRAHLEQFTGDDFDEGVEQWVEQGVELGDYQIQGD